jgi:hypothetical protein
MKHISIISLITFLTLILKAVPLSAQVIDTTDNCCAVKQLPAKPHNYHLPVIKNSGRFCDTLLALLVLPASLSSRMIDTGLIYSANVELRVATDGPPLKAKLSFCSKDLCDFIQERLHAIVNSMQWAPAYYMKRGKKVVAASDVYMSLGFVGGRLTSVAFFDDENTKLLKIDLVKE